MVDILSLRFKGKENLDFSGQFHWMNGWECWEPAAKVIRMIARAQQIKMVQLVAPIRPFIVT
jgi:hypothetical protein